MDNIEYLILELTRRKWVRYIARVYEVGLECHNYMLTVRQYEYDKSLHMYIHNRSS